MEFYLEMFITYGFMLTAITNWITISEKNEYT